MTYAYFPRILCRESLFPLRNRNVIVQLTAGLRTGAATGDIGELDTSAVEVTQLDGAIAYAKRVGCQTLVCAHLWVHVCWLRMLVVLYVSSGGLSHVGHGSNGAPYEGSAGSW